MLSIDKNKIWSNSVWHNANVSYCTVCIPTPCFDYVLHRCRTFKAVTLTLSSTYTSYIFRLLSYKKCQFFIHKTSVAVVSFICSWRNLLIWPEEPSTSWLDSCVWCESEKKDTRYIIIESKTFYLVLMYNFWAAVKAATCVRVWFLPCREAASMVLHLSALVMLSLSWGQRIEGLTERVR